MSKRFIQIDPSHYTRANKLSEDLRTIYCYLAEHCNTQDDFELTIWVNPKTKKGGYKVILQRGQYVTHSHNIAKLVGSTSRRTGRRKLDELERTGLIQVNVVKRIKGQPYQGHIIITISGIEGSPFDVKRYQEVQNMIKNEVKKIPSGQKQALNDTSNLAKKEDISDPVYQNRGRGAPSNDLLSIPRYNQEEADQKTSAIQPIASNEKIDSVAMCDGIDISSSIGPCLEAGPNNVMGNVNSSLSSGRKLLTDIFTHISCHESDHNYCSNIVKAFKGIVNPTIAEKNMYKDAYDMQRQIKEGC